MSYSFNVTRATKDELIEDVMAEFAKVVEQQAVHATDAEQAKAAVASLLGLTFDDDARDLTANVSGSIWTTGAGVEQVSLSINISHVDRKVAEPAT